VYLKHVSYNKNNHEKNVFSMCSWALIFALLSHEELILRRNSPLIACGCLNVSSIYRQYANPDMDSIIPLILKDWHGSVV